MEPLRRVLLVILLLSLGCDSAEFIETGVPTDASESTDSHTKNGCSDKECALILGEGNPCSIPTCNMESGACFFLNSPNGSECSPSLTCNGLCLEGVCEPQSCVELCGNGIDDDGVYGSDCEDPTCSFLPQCSTKPCPAVDEIRCGDLLTGTTLGAHASNRLDTYSCATNILDGPEVLYRIPNGLPLHYKASLTEASEGLGISVLSGESDALPCEALECLVPFADTVEWEGPTDSNEMWLVVDGPLAASGSYGVSLDCFPLIETHCSDQLDEDGDGQTDCEDPDCAMASVCLGCAPPAGSIQCNQSLSLSLPGVPLPAPAHCNQPTLSEPLETSTVLEVLAPQFPVRVLATATSDSPLNLTASASNKTCQDTACLDSGSSLAWVPEPTQASTVTIAGNLSSKVELSIACVPAMEQSCNNQDDEDMDGLTDCQDPDCDEHVACTQCSVITNLSCGAQIQWDTASPLSTLIHKGLDCGTEELGGPESTFAFSSQVTTQITLTLSDPGGAHEIMVYEGGEDACINSACIAVSSQGTVDFLAIGGSEYILVVDSAGDAEAFELELHCSPPKEMDCTNGEDEDGDGSADCNDSDCQEQEECLFPPETCTNNEDDDNDGAVDCADPDCLDEPNCQGDGETCGNLIDDDADGAIDCDDPDCLDTAPCGQCESSIKISCGETLTGNLVEGNVTDLMSLYPCLPIEIFSGNEIAVRLAAPLTSTVHLELEATNDIGMILIEEPAAGCFSGHCIQGIVTSSHAYALSPNINSTYYVVLDSQEGQNTTYGLSLICPED